MVLLIGIWACMLLLPEAVSSQLAGQVTFVEGDTIVIYCNASVVGVPDTFSLINRVMLLQAEETKNVVMAYAQQKDGVANGVANTGDEFTKWTFDLPSDSDLQRELSVISNNRDSLQIVATKNNAQCSDSAVFKCLVSYMTDQFIVQSLQKDSNYTAMGTVSVPTMKITPTGNNNENEYVENTTLTVKCTANGLENYEFRWHSRCDTGNAANPSPWTPWPSNEIQPNTSFPSLNFDGSADDCNTYIYAQELHFSAQLVDNGCEIRCQLGMVNAENVFTSKSSANMRILVNRKEVSTAKPTGLTLTIRIIPEVLKIQVVVGAKTLFNCIGSVTNSDDPSSVKLTYGWEKDGHPITNDDKTMSPYIRRSSLNWILAFDGVAENDAGVYRCTVTDFTGQSVSKEIELEVIAPLAVESKAEQFGILGQDGVIICNASGHPPPVIDWLDPQGNAITHSSDKYRIGDGKLTIKKLDFSDAGNYVCDVSVVSTGTLKSFTINFQVFESPRIRQNLTIQPENPKLGDHVTIQCEAEGSPPPLYTFKKGDILMPSTQVDDNKGILTFVSLRREDEDDYTCIATNKAGSAELETHLDVLIPPIIEDIHEVTVATEGSKVTIACRAEGDPEPGVAWRRLGSSEDFALGLQAGGGPIIEKIANNVSSDEIKQVELRMTFYAIRPQHEGAYICTASNSVGQATSSIVISVQFAPIVEPLRREISFTCDAYVANLTCQVTANPPASILWTKTSPSDPYQMEQLTDLKIDDRISARSLVITVTGDTNKADTNYTCQAFNTIGVTEATMTLIHPKNGADALALFVDNQPSIPDGQLVKVTTGQLVIVHCDIQEELVRQLTLTCGRRQNITTGTRPSLSITLDKTNNNERCTCVVEHPSGCHNVSKHFTFKVHFGPEDVMATVNTSRIKLCPSHKEPIIMYCDVPIDGVNPKPEVVVKSLNEVIQPINDEQVIGNYRFHFSFIPTSGGNVSITCVAINPMITSIKEDDSTTVTVLESPTEDPIVFIVDNLLRLTNGQTVNVTAGQSLQVNCKVQGGVPVVSSVTLTCERLQNTTEGTQASLDMSPDKTIKKETCKCTAEHLSGCYNKSTEFTVNVHYAAVVFNFTLTDAVAIEDNDTRYSNLQRFEVHAGTVVTFTCDAGGNPSPELKIKGQNATQPLSSDIYLNKAVASKAMACRDTDFYDCQATNGFEEISTRTILLIVICTPELLDPPGTDSQPMTHSRKRGTEDVEIEFDIVGRPVPKNYPLEKVVQRTKRSTDSNLIDPSRYSVKFVELDEKRGRVTLLIYSMTDRHNGEYVLTIHNGVGGGLPYGFHVEIEKENDDSSDNIAVIVGGVVAVLIVIVAVILIIVFLRRKGPKKAQSENAKNTMHEESRTEEDGVPGLWTKRPSFSQEFQKSKDDLPYSIRF